MAHWGSSNLLILGGTIVTNDPAQPLARAVAVTDGKIRAVGELPDVRKKVRGPTSVIDLQGAVLFPGLTDAHGHLGLMGDALATCPLVGTRSFQEVIDTLVVYARRGAAPSGGWLIGHGWSQNQWPDAALPDGRALQSALPGRAIWLWHIDTHTGVASPAALAEAGITRHTPDPDGGRIVRDAAGEPTGVLVERATELVERALPVLAVPEQRKRLIAALARAAAVGLTGVHDLAMSSETAALCMHLDAIGRLPIHVHGAIRADDPKIDEWYAHGPHQGNRFTARAVKFFADGTLGSRSAALLDDYTDCAGHRGWLLQSPGVLEAQIRRAMEAGFQPIVHAIGDAANRLVLDIFEKLVIHQRPRIEHAQLVHADDLRRFAALGVIASMQPVHATSDMPWLEHVIGPERMADAYVWRTLQQCGTHLAFGSDFPVERPHPLEGLYAALTRQDRQGQPADAWQPEQTLTFAEALAAFTTGAAYAAFCEDRRGYIRPGYDADFTMVRGDLNGLITGEGRPDPVALLDARVIMTIVGGHVVYQVK